MKSTESMIQTAPQETHPRLAISNVPAVARRRFIRFPGRSSKFLLSIALLSCVVLGHDTLHARSRSTGASSGENNACGKAKIPLTLRDGLALATISINQKPMTFVVDSGGTTMINSEWVSLPLVRQIWTGAVTVSAAERLELWDVVHVKSLRLGTAELHDSEILSRNLQFLEKQLGRPLNGILGNDVLRLWDSVSIDYKRKVLVLERSHCWDPNSAESLLRLQRDAMPVSR
jgi:Aspartyl protease